MHNMAIRLCVSSPETITDNEYTHNSKSYSNFENYFSLTSHILYLSTLLHAILNSLCISSPSVMQQIIFSFHFHLTQHVSALYGHLQVSESVETATLHQCALKLHMLKSIYYYKIIKIFLIS
jgi:hypothetical protein